MAGDFKNAFPDAVHLCSFKPFRDNGDLKLQSLNLDEVIHQEILADIVGVEGCEQTQLGLVDPIDVSDFDAKLASLEEQWNKLERKGRKVIPRDRVEPEFYSWFVRENGDIVCNNVCNNMIQCVRVAVQLGDPPDKFTPMQVSPLTTSSS